MTSIACTGPIDEAGSGDTTTAEETAGEDGGVTTEVIIGAACKGLGDCEEPTICMPDVSCVEGECLYGYAAKGTGCGSGCYVNGTCNGKGECMHLEAVECDEIDGNICTVPSCEPADGNCFEHPIEDGEPPYISSECWDGVVCLGGEQDNSNAVPTPLLAECEAMGESLDPMECIDQYLCIGGEQKCKAIFKVDGVQCWTEDDGGGECIGRSCSGGECQVDHGLDAFCAQEDYPDECQEGCLDCTTLACHWIPDPANPENPTHKVRYCKPEAKVGFVCESDPCLIGQGCGMGSQATGPLGKETLGKCAGGQEKSKEQCAEELGKPALACIMAGLDCDAEQGGCLVEQEKADKWCWPPEWKCFDKNDTYCSHLDSGENWNDETGCNTAWIDLNCDDTNDCTVDTCKNEAGEWNCGHEPINGSACDDDDPCTKAGVCEGGICAGMAPKCFDVDDNPCNDPSCDPFTGECKPAQTNGYPCNDGNACTIGDTCQDLVCQSGTAKECDDGEVCTDDFCDTGLGCVHDNNVKPCDDGDKTTENDYCQDGTCQPGTPVVCDDNNICTQDQTDALLGCTYSPVAGPCDDFDLCTVNDQCAGGQCVPGPDKDCEDGKYCTVDGCNPVAGCTHDNLNDYVACPGGLAFFCIGGECTCVPSCDQKECGNDGCGGDCGDCPAGKECEGNICKSQGGDSTTVYNTSLISFSCFMGLVEFNYTTLTFVDNGSKLYIMPSMNGCCNMEGDSAQDGSFTASCPCPGDGVCDENYKLTGTVNGNTLNATFTATFNGMFCSDCVYYSTNVTGTAQ